MWNGKKWCDGRIRRVGYSYQETTGTALAVEIRYKECGCGNSVKAGQCRHVFSALDCGRAWVRDCPVQRKHRRATAELDRSTLPKPSKPRERESPSWPTAKFHRLLPVHGHKKRMKEAEGHEPQAEVPRLPWRVSDGGNDAAKKWKTVGRRMPAWRWPSHMEGTLHRAGEEECTTTKAVLPEESMTEAGRTAEERRRWRLEREQDWKRWQSSQKITVAPSAQGSVEGGAGQTMMRPHDGTFDGEELSSMFFVEEEARVTKKSKKKEPEKPKKSKKARRSSATSATMAIYDEERKKRAPSEQGRTPEPPSCASTKAENGARELVLAYGEWATLQSAGGVVWVEEGPQVVLLKPGDNAVRGPQRRLDFPDTWHFSNSFLFAPSEAVVR